MKDLFLRKVRETAYENAVEYFRIKIETWLDEIELNDLEIDQEEALEEAMENFDYVIFERIYDLLDTPF